MSLVVNNNLMAANTARNLNAHYGRLATSTQRLSSGLRINSAADDAAGLAIRELQRADIAALQQGARNANDAISMIQVADGSLGIIDEKLIRMKELAEQAATGTYDSTQRLMIESEYQAMASEITRIANATDFNGTKLLDGTLAGEHDGSGMVSEGKMKIHFGTGNDSAEDYYYIEIGECTAQAFGLGNASTWEDVQRRGVTALADSLKQSIRNNKNLTPAQQGELLSQIGEVKPDGTYTGMMDSLNKVLTNATDYKQAYEYLVKGDEDFLAGNATLFEDYLAAVAKQESATVTDEKIEAATDSLITEIQNALDSLKDPDPNNPTAPAADWVTQLTDKLDAIEGLNTAKQDIIAAATNAYNTYDTAAAGGTPSTTDADTFNAALEQIITDLKDSAGPSALNAAITEDGKAQAEAAVADSGGDPNAIENYWNSLRPTEQQKLQYAWGQAAVDKLSKGITGLDKQIADATAANDTDLAKTLQAFRDMVEDTGLLDFGANLVDENNQPITDADGNEIAKVMLDKALQAVSTKIGHMDFAGFTVETQEDAQMALDAINNAIVSKDKIRAHLGATQNRLENTVSNLNIQAENLQAAESRISDVDVATEMTQFVRNQILTQSAVAMLSQANSLPQMAMQLIGG